MPLTFTPSPTVQGGTQGEAVAHAGGWWFVPGTLTFSGSYTGGGDALTKANLAKRIPVAGTVREVLPVGTARGNTVEYDLANDKLKVYTAANTEHTAVGYNGALTATPVPIAFWVRV